MSLDYSALLKSMLSTQTASIVPHKLPDGRKVWVRCINRGNLRILYTLQTLIALYLFKVPSLRGVFCNPKEAISDEANRLRDLEQAGVNAPRLLAQRSDGLMMSDLGQADTLDHQLHEAQARQQDLLALWQSGLVGINSVHQKDSYLSQAFSRNILVLDHERWGFIDFEEDPRTKLSLAQCQVRDLLFYLHSTVFMIDDVESAANAFEGVLNQGSDERKQCFIEASRALAKWQRWRLIAKLGRDGQRIAKVLYFLSLISKSKHDQ
ncbi:hypothetical protein L0B52_05505 [Suttonella sp. R2A3]|uniref:hypothetical protein n=1 Tax=Suttonella sp. R2A3 TaxID=2908648 RepID=UPI001F274727|nr:hypothetical protein [Suttonella sp. R2A3]UJF23806.1 hypothetical protein L0B52_05505 [Suttonella sp. R2A3]